MCVKNRFLAVVTAGALTLLQVCPPISETAVAETACAWTLDTRTAVPAQELTYCANITNAVTTWGLSGALYFPAETLALLTAGSSDNLDAMENEAGVYASLSLSQNWADETETDAGGEIVWFSMSTTEMVEPLSTTGELFRLTLDLPEEETVCAIAAAYGIEAVTENGVTYYTFPVQWLSVGTDFGTLTDSSGNVSTIEVARYTYLDASETDIFEDTVTLYDGAIQVVISDSPDTTEATSVSETVVTTTESAVTSTETGTTVLLSSTDLVTIETTTETEAEKTMISSATDAAVTSTESTILTDSMTYGDLNLDGEINLADAVLLCKACATLVDFNEVQEANADCYGDGVRDLKDVSALLWFIIERIDTLPY